MISIVNIGRTLSLLHNQTRTYAAKMLEKNAIDVLTTMSEDFDFASFFRMGRKNSIPILHNIATIIIARICANIIFADYTFRL